MYTTSIAVATTSLLNFENAAEPRTACLDQNESAYVTCEMQVKIMLLGRAKQKDPAPSTGEVSFQCPRGEFRRSLVAADYPRHELAALRTCREALEGAADQR